MKKLSLFFRKKLKINQLKTRQLCTEKSGFPKKKGEVPGIFFQKSGFEKVAPQIISSKI